jgi:uncharacterized membrane protein
VTVGQGRPAPGDLDRSVARLLTFGVYSSVGLLTIGVLLLFVRAISPLAGAPAFDPALIVDDIVNLRPLGFLSLGLIAVIATPAARVVASLVGYLRRGERAMALVSVLILAVIAVSVALALALEA